jgi:hypothetical protein
MSPIKRNPRCCDDSNRIVRQRADLHQEPIVADLAAVEPPMIFPSVQRSGAPPWFAFLRITLPLLLARVWARDPAARAGRTGGFAAAQVVTSPS